MLYRASCMRMPAFRWLEPNFRFHAYHFSFSIFPRLALPALSSTSLFQSHFTHLLLLHPTIVYYSCQNPMSCIKTDGFWTLAEFFAFYQRGDPYACVRHLQASSPSLVAWVFQSVGKSFQHFYLNNGACEFPRTPTSDMYRQAR